MSTRQTGAKLQAADQATHGYRTSVTLDRRAAGGRQVGSAASATRFEIIGSSLSCLSLR